MKKILLTLVVVSALTSCSPDVFVAGNRLSSIGHVAMYWKNGNAVILSDSTSEASGDAITVNTVGTSNDVYVAGFEKEKGKLSVAKYWKNGIAVRLTDGTKDANATGIAVVGNDVYVSGKEYNDTVHVAKYWKNGTAIALTDGSKEASANAIAVVGNDVYLAGVEYEGRTQREQTPIAKYWKNGVPTVLTDSAAYATVTAIAVAGNDVYVAGSVNNIACYWKNGAITLLTKNPSYGACVNAITVTGDDVYAAGFEWRSHHPGSLDSVFTADAEYWKKGTVVYLSRNPSNVNGDSYASGIAIWGNDIYVAGYDNSAKYWKNGTATVLQNHGVATSIAVKD